MLITRFAPSPTGLLHLGHAYAALFAAEMAQRDGGHFLLRIEDIDPVRCKPEFTEAILEDLSWLGLVWETPVRVQSQHLDAYKVAFEKLRAQGVVYPCFCTRKHIADEASAAGQAPHLAQHGPDGPVYPGTCRHLTEAERSKKLDEQGKANWRLDINKAVQFTGKISWHDRKRGEIEAQPRDFGDVVLARKDVPTSYHLSVTVDDHLQNITLVTRGEDLFRATDIHCLLQNLLGYPTPDYEHHPLLLDAEGKRFAKRDKAKTLRVMRESGMTPREIRGLCGFT